MSMTYSLRRGSEFGSWAQAAHVHHACVAMPGSINRRCLRSLRVAGFEVDSFEVDVQQVLLLVMDALRRLRVHG